MVKPVLGYSSIGVYKINKNVNLTSVIHKINAACKVNRDGVLKNFNYTFLVESYVEGVQISVDGIVNNNKILFAGIVETVVSPPPNFTAYANYFPPRIPKLAQNKAFKYCIKVIKALDFNNCAFHCELKLTKQGPVLIEIACRPPGGSIMEGYKKAYGIDFFTAMLDLWLDNNISLSCKHSVYLHQAGVFYEKKGILKSIEGIKKLKEKRHIHEIYRVSHIGHRLTNYPDIPAPIYYFSVEAPTAAALEKEIQAIKEAVIFKII